MNNYINNRWIIILFLAIPFLVSSSPRFDVQELFRNVNINSLNRGAYTANDSFSNISFEEMQRFVKTTITEVKNPIEWFYREPATQRIVEHFLIQKTKDKKISETVLLYTTERNLPISLVFSLIFVESSFSKVAVNSNATSKDIGLFQLNTTTFRHLSRNELLHLETNVKNGTDYLKYAFSLDPNPKIALAIYNAGPSRPLRGETPESTKLYVRRILEYSELLKKEFVSYVWNTLNLSSIDLSEV